jgi:hypothetical protein
LYDLVVVKVEDPELQSELKALVLEALDMGIRLVQRLIDRKIKMLEWDVCKNKEAINTLRSERLKMEKENLA